MKLNNNDIGKLFLLDSGDIIRIYRRCVSTIGCAGYTYMLYNQEFNVADNPSFGNTIVCRVILKP